VNNGVDNGWTRSGMNPTLSNKGSSPASTSLATHLLMIIAHCTTILETLSLVSFSYYFEIRLRTNPLQGIDILLGGGASQMPPRLTFGRLRTSDVSFLQERRSGKGMKRCQGDGPARDPVHPRRACAAKVAIGGGMRRGCLKSKSRWPLARSS
jgi:hypothetical protein